MYNLSISLANPTNQSDAHIQVSFRPLNQSDGITKEACRLTASEKCGFEQLSPFVEDWVFVMLKNKENATLKLDVKLGLQGNIACFITSSREAVLWVCFSVLLITPK